MFLRADRLRRHPAAFIAMTGLTTVEFDVLVGDLWGPYRAAERARRERPGRKHAVGAGHPFSLAPHEQMLLTVVWLRLYPTMEVLGFLFGVSDTTAQRAVGRVLPLLEAAGRDSMRLPDPGRKQRRDLGAVLGRVPELAVVIDSLEQRVQRPRDRAAADRHYSGKKKMHTLKSQVAVTQHDGRLGAVRLARPPGPRHAALWRQGVPKAALLVGCGSGGRAPQEAARQAAPV